MDKSYFKHFIKTKKQTNPKPKQTTTQDNNKQYIPVKPEAWLRLFLAQKSVLYIYFNFLGYLQP